MGLQCGGEGDTYSTLSIAILMFDETAVSKCPSRAIMYNSSSTKHFYMERTARESNCQILQLKVQQTLAAIKIVISCGCLCSVVS